MELKLLSCPLCQQPHFNGVDSLRLRLISAANSQLKCPVCDEYFLGLDKLTIHLFSHIDGVVEINNQIDKQKQEEIRVEEEVNKNDDDLNECLNAVSINLEQSTSSNNNIKCDICNFSFNDPSILDMHQKLLHQTTPDVNTGLYSYHCHLCSKKFKKRGTLMVHLRVVHFGFSHHDKDRRCCNESQDNISTSKRGLDNKQWECDICSKLFTTKYFLKKHKRLHTGEMPYFCALCNKYFTFQQSYHKHMLYHSSDKPHVCSECGRAFKELSTLQNHQRIHSGERPFACETCGKKFRQRVSYLVHQRIHTGIMPYKCTVCNKSFRYKVSQRSHKCLINPIENVIKLETDNKKNQNAKCIMSVDLDTGNIKLIDTENENKSLINNDNTRDLYSMILSPILPEVESLCLSTNSPPITDLNNEENSTINQQTLSELF